ncbi:hypothetical protein Glove_714g11 [Diversispora epigaea]|uniref:Eukaryotic translation initiation factor 3 30 kDa subunit n=1 Tax=Diversispora epigaea TaxID=1348612 RepID=A0A397G1Z9_9GLOM|nr:hypothetical protein Glove_714g11 [Diversispora epigaea]
MNIRKDLKELRYRLTHPCLVYLGILSKRNKKKLFALYNKTLKNIIMNWGNDLDGPAPNISVSVNKKWVDEDLELDQVKEAWDEESSDEEAKTEDISKKKKVSVAQKIAEREQKKKAEKKFDFEDDEELDLEEKKRREAQAILDADLENAEGLFQGLTIKDTRPKSKVTTLANKEVVIKGVVSPLDKINPQTNEEFDEFASLLSERIKKYEKNKFYPNFISGLVRELCVNLRDVEIRKITGTLTILANEKSKDTQKTKKKGKTKPSLAKDLDVIDTKSYDDDYYDYDDEFM